MDENVVSVGGGLFLRGRNAVMCGTTRRIWFCFAFLEAFSGPASEGA